MTTTRPASSPRGSKLSNLSIALFLLAALGFLASFLFAGHFVPIEGCSWDSLLYLAPGQRMYQGEMIYRDVFEFLPPGTALINFCMFKIFGLKLWIPDLLAILLGVGLAWLGIVVSGKMMRPAMALLPSAAFLVSSRGFICDSTHHWYSVLTAVAAIAVMLEKRTTTRIAAAGFLCGLSASFTQTRGLAAVVGFALYLWWEARQKHEGRRSLARKEAWLLFCFVAAFLIVNAYFIWEAGPARYFWCTVVFVLKYYPKTSAANTFQVIKTQFPVYQSLSTFLLPFAKWLLLFGFIPLVFLLFFVQYWRESPNRRLEHWDRPMLVAIVGLFMLLSIAPAPDFVRMRVSILPAFILMCWLLDSRRRLMQLCAVALAAIILITGVYSLAKQRPKPVGILATSQGELAYTEPEAYEEDSWIQQHTHPLDYFYELAYSDVYFYLDLRNPTPLSCIENNGYVTQEQVSAIIQGLERHQVHYILWGPSYLDTASQTDDHLGPLRDYLKMHYALVKVFSNTKEIWERKSD
jgi:hypothetical protein